MTKLIGKYDEPWPDAERGPFRLRATVHLIDGRPEVTRIELSPLDPKAPTAMRTTPDIRAAMVTTPIIESVVSKSTLKRERLHARILADDETLPVRRGGPQPEWAKKPVVQTWAKRKLVETEHLEEKPLGRPPLYDRAHFAQVAGIYVDALGAGDDPRSAVAGHFHVSESTAAKWIYRCRREPLNLLPPTARGRRSGAGVA